MRVEFWARGFDSVHALLVGEAMTVNAVIKTFCLGRVGGNRVRAKGQNRELGVSLCPKLYPFFLHHNTCLLECPPFASL